MFQTFHFLRPEWLLALPVIVLLLIVMIRRSIQASGWEKVCDPALLQFQLTQQNQPAAKPSRLFHWLLPIFFLITIIALAGPTWEKKQQPVFQQGNALVIILDLSLSMNAKDIKPSRLERAKLKIVDILNQKQEGQTALIAFAGDAHTVSPLTIDNKTIMSLLPALDTSIMPLSGSHTADAVITARQLLINSGFSHGDILLISDGIDLTQEDELEDQINSLYSQGYRFSAIGVGSHAGSPIPMPGQGGFVKDPSGQVVLSKLDDAPLKNLTRTGGGSYHQLSLDNSDFAEILDTGRLANDAVMAQDQQLEQWVDAGAYITVLLIPLALMAFRKGLMAIVITLLVTPVLFSKPAMAEANDKNQAIRQWQNLWSTPDQQGQNAFQAQNYEQAADQFSNPSWKASAYYRSGDYAKALEQYQQAEDATGLYNAANALANLQKFQQAIDTYDEALKIDPQFKDAIKNRDYLKQLLAQQAQQSGQNSDQQQQDSDKPSEGQDQQQQSQADSGSPGKDSQDSQSEQDNAGSQGTDDNNKNGSEKQLAQDPVDQENNSEDGQAQQPGQQRKSELESEPQQQNESPAEKPDDEQVADQQAPAGQQPEDARQEGSTETDTSDVLSQLSQEEQQSLKQWLQRIPDNPGELLRVKFRNNSMLKQRQQDSPAQYQGEQW